MNKPLKTPEKSTKEMLKPLYVDDFNTIKVALVLDPRRDAKALNEFLALSSEDVKFLKPDDLVEVPMAVRLIYGRTIKYFRTGKKASPIRFNNLRTASGNSDDVRLRKEVKILFDLVVKYAKELYAKDQFDFDKLNTLITGRSPQTFLELWLDMISKKKLKTQSAYMDAYKSFTKHAGMRVPFERINTTLIEGWAASMKSEGKSGASIGMYLRAIRVPIRRCIADGLIKLVEFPFGRSTDDNKVRIPRGRKRTYNFIDVDTINQLRAFNCDTKDWHRGYTEDARRSIDMWVFSYLAGGMNMTDIVDLEYNDYYYHSGQKEFQFIRKKTMDANDEALEVLIPISDEVRAILNRYAAKPIKGGRVFPYLLGDDFDGSEVAKLRRISQANQNIRKHLHRVCTAMGLSQLASPTWARHSFKTNATHAGIPNKYVEMAMGHSIGTVEGNYLGAYPFVKRLEFTEALLRTEQVNLLDQLKGLSAEELAKLLKQL